jgi:hypothetical protein
MGGVGLRSLEGIDGFGERIYSYPAILTEILSADFCTNA